MEFIDVSRDARTAYRLREGERRVFFMLNRVGEVAFELCAPGAAAYVFAFNAGRTKTERRLSIVQKHLAPQTISHSLIKNVLQDDASLSSEGLIRIERSATRVDASQEIRSLLLSPQARVLARPALEILNQDVRCRHAATASAMDGEGVFFLQSRGLSLEQAERLLMSGFVNDLLERMRVLGVAEDVLRPVKDKIGVAL